MSAFWQEQASLAVAALPQPSMSGVLWQSTESAFVMKVPGLAECEVRDGQAVSISRAPTADDLDPRLIVQGLPLAALCVQRGWLALQAAAVSTARGAIVIAGHSGAGKSTLAAALAQRGHAVLADAVVPLIIHEAQISVQPAMAELALWRESTQRLGFDSTGWQPVRQGLDRYYVPGVSAESLPQPLHALYILGVHNQRAVHLLPLEGQERFLLVAQFLFNRMLPERPTTRERQFQAIAALVAQARMFKLQRPDAAWSLKELVATVEGELAR